MANLTSPTRATKVRVPQREHIPYDGLKRVLDALISATALVALSPVLLALAVAVWLDDRGPALFRQDRIGRNGKHFEMLKFRSMSQGTPNISTEDMKLLGTSYYTRVGTLLRKTSLDELPQLWNVLKGDMSFVGPRPALFNQDELIAFREAAGVNIVRPGITGLAQVEGRDDLDDETKVSYDRDYVTRRGFGVDVSILWRTFAAVVSARGNY